MVLEVQEVKMVRKQLIHREKRMTLAEAREALVIDEDNVYYELTKHAEKKAKVGTSWSWAASESLEAKERVKIIKAQVAVELQKKEKLTDKKCEAFVNSDKRVLAAIQEWVRKVQLEEEWKSLRQDWSDRTTMLGSMTRLICEGLRGTRQTQGALGAAKPEVAENIRKTINKQRLQRSKDA